MRRVLLVAILLIVTIKVFTNHSTPIPQFTDEMNKQICIEESI